MTAPVWVEIAVSLASLLGNGFFLYQLLRHFLALRSGPLWKVLLLVTLGLASSMIIWVGDPNLLYTFPVFVVLLLVYSKGDRVGRLAVALIFFSLIMSVSALLDTYLFDADTMLTRVSRTAVFGLLFLLLRRHLPREVAALPRRLWNLILALAMMPLCALTAVVLLSYREWISLAAHSMALNQGMVILPFTLATSVVLLFAILALADHEALEEQVRLAGLREIYYQGVQRENQQIRTLRHDLRNHVMAVSGLLERGETEQALGYLEQLTQSSALSGGGRLCDNEVANVVLTAKAKEMTQRGLKGVFQVSLPACLLISEVDLCALLGNALDNAMEAAEKSGNPVIHVRCRVEKGLFMLQVENALAGDETPDLATTKADKTAHGFGLPGMREIAQRYGGSLEASADHGRFELLVCLPQ